MQTDDTNLSDLTEYLNGLPARKEPHDADYLLLTCMDFRFLRLIAQYMGGWKYDHVALAGAALGAVVEQKPHWRETFLDHLNLARRLHQIESGIIILEHRDCGAYREFGLLGPNPDPADERAAHKAQVDKFIEKMVDIHMLPVKGYLLSLPGGVDPLTANQLTLDELT
ncbi:MAG: hypothetical protein QOF02_3831 [Blastocatellia bacterium]|jgi:carbonic anhydrase|nr:hypothetical protein [Blastocatellia bacterium]